MKKSILNAVTKKRFFSLLLFVMLASSYVLATDITWTWSASSGVFGTVQSYEATLNGTTSPSTSSENSKTWTVTRDAVLYTGFTSSCIQLGKSSNPETVTLESSAFSGTIKSVAIECSSASGNHTVSISVGSTSYLAATATSSWATVSSKSGTGTSKGLITITLTKGTAACYVKSITVVYEPNTTGPFNVIYYGNGNTSGTAPTDAVNHAKNSNVTVLGNTGDLAKTNYIFNGWNTKRDASGTHYAAGGTIENITSDMFLYAEWITLAANKVFNLVEDVSTLAVDQHIIIVSYHSSSSTYYAMSSDRGNNRLAVAASASEFEMSNSNKTLTTASTTSLEMITLTSTSSGYFGFQALDGNYLYAASGGNYLKTKAYAGGTLDNDSKWKITLTSGTFAVQADQSSNNYNMRLNGGNNPPIFSCYSSGQTAVMIYAEETCEPLGSINGDVSFTKTAYTITATWPTTEDGNETGYSVQLYNNNGSGAKGAAIGTPVAITGTGSANRTCTFGAKTPVDSRLTANHQYFIGVTPTYSGAGTYCPTGTEVVGNTTTNQTYTVTYAAGGGTGTMTDSNSPYEAGDAVTVLTNTFEKPGYPFASWSAVDASSNVVDVSSGSFTMPSSNVTITATWGAALQDEFLDKEHGNTRKTRTGANQTTPSLDNYTPENEYCNDLHYKFVGWVLSTSVNDNGTLKNDAVVVPGGQGSWNCTGSTYYAVWAAENE